MSKACGLCKKDPAAGLALIGDVRYCHGDDDQEPTCYMRSQWLLLESKLCTTLERLAFVRNRDHWKREYATLAIPFTNAERSMLRLVEGATFKVESITALPPAPDVDGCLVTFKQTDSGADLALDSAILRALLTAANSYFWITPERMGIETGIDLTDQQARRIQDIRWEN